MNPLYFPVELLILIVSGFVCMWLWYDKKFLLSALLMAFFFALGRGFLLVFDWGENFLNLHLDSHPSFWLLTGLGSLIFILIFDHFLKKSDQFLNGKKAFTHPWTFLLSSILGIGGLLGIMVLIPGETPIYPITQKTMIGVVSIAIGVVAFEEYVFRGLVLNALKKHLANSGAVVLQALIFTLSHLFFVTEPWMFVLAFVEGLYLGALRNKLSVIETTFIHGAGLAVLLLAPL